jgi:biopolymer transport protein ExbB
MNRNGLLPRILLLVTMLFLVVGLVSAAVSSSDGAGGDQLVSGKSFFNQFVLSGGPIVWFVLLPMSVAVVSIVLQQGFAIRRKNLLPAGIAGDIVAIIRQFGLGPLAVKLAGQRDFVSLAVLRAAAALNLGHNEAQVKDLLAQSLQEQAFGLLRKIEWANIIGNVAPMVGLFGTVFGMIKAFNGIVIAGGQPQPAHLAGGISIALVTTFWGLLVAIPALAVHGVFRHRIETLTSEAAIEAQFVLSEINSSLKGHGGEEGFIEVLQTSLEGTQKEGPEIRSTQYGPRHHKTPNKRRKLGTQKSSSPGDENL